MKNEKMLKGLTLGKIKKVSLFKLKNPDELCFQLVDADGQKMKFSIDADVFGDVEELALVLTLSKQGLLPDGMWVHNLDANEVMNHLRQRCTSFERINL